MKFIDESDNHTADQIEKIRLFHQKTSEKYISIIFEESAALQPYDQSILMRDDETKILDDLDAVSRTVMVLVSAKIAKTTDHYSYMFIAFLAILAVLALILMVIIITGKKRS